MRDFADKVAVITGAGGGFGREFARLAHSLGMKLVLADVERDALDAIAHELSVAGGRVVAEVVNVADDDEVRRLADIAFDGMGAVHLLFNNAGVGSGGLLWESTEKDWQWVLGVNLWGVVHGVRHFLPRMLASGEPGHVVNTASVAGLISAPTMGVYNVTKHAVVALTETLYQDLKLVKASIGASVLCPAFVPTGIAESQRNRPDALRDELPVTASQRAAQASISNAVKSGRVSAADVARMSFDAIREDRFYILTHPGILGAVQLRCDDLSQQRNPSDPFAAKPELKPRTQ